MKRSSEEDTESQVTQAASNMDSRKETTEQELESFHIVEVLLRQVVGPEGIVYRDTIKYMGILLDDTNRRPICRLHFNRRQKYIGLFDAEKTETRHAIETLNDIYQYAEQLKATVKSYDDNGGGLVDC